MNYEESRLHDIDEAKKQATGLIETLKALIEEYDDSDGEIRSLQSDIFVDLVQAGLRFNHFYYDDTHYGRCGDYYDGHNSGLLTTLSEFEIKKLMRQFAEQHRGGYCHHKFLESAKNYGIYYTGEPSFSSQEYMTEIDLKQITEKDLYSEQTYSEIIKEREEAARRLAAVEAEKRRMVAEKQEREVYEKLKQKYGN